MKKSYYFKFLIGILALFVGLPIFAGTIRLSSTIGPVDAGIIPLLTKTYSSKTGVKFTITKAGTGATINNAKTGKFDLIIVHARSLEDKFIAEGYGQNRKDIMYNDFVILGPKSDPAGIKGMNSAIDALAKIAKTKSLFITRGDNSGTHVSEMNAWKKAGIILDAKKDNWYIKFELGNTGNGPSTLFADKQKAYIWMDRATYLKQKEKIKIVPLVSGDPIMLNLIASIEVNPKKFPDINNKDVVKFVDWLCGEEAQRIIKDFEVEKFGEPLFFPNSDEWNSKYKK